MRKLALIAALALGCDDPGVSSKVADVLAFGAVEAHMRCSGLTVDSAPPYSTYAVHQFVDGARYIALRRDGGPSFIRLCARDESCAADGRIEQDTGVRDVYIDGTDIIVEHLSNGIEGTFDISTYCTGRNLGAF